MNLEQWEEFWAYLVGDYSIIDQMGKNRFDSVGEYLEWQRQEWIKYHKKWNTESMVREGEEIIHSLRKTARNENGI